MVPLTLIPISVAAPLSSETASIAWPIFVLLMKEVSATITTTQVRMVIMVTAEIESAPPASFKVGRFTTEVNCLVLEPKISSARF